MNGIIAWLHQLDLNKLLEPLVIVIAAILCVSIHETCHGLAALWLGDRTAKNDGRLSLNPLRHIDPIGLILMVVAHFGWAKPVMIDPRNFKHPKRDMAITAAAGPISNLLLALVALFFASLLFPVVLAHPDSIPLYWLYMLFLYIASLSVGMCVFNIIPISPLDGSKVLFGILPERIYWKIMRFERYGMLALLAIVLSGVLDKPLYFLNNHLYSALARLVWPAAEWIARLYS